MKIKKRYAVLKKMSKEDGCFVNAFPQKLISFMWELTAELWSLKGSEYVERRLQRNITNLVKNRKATGREKDKLDVKYLELNSAS